MSNYGAHPIHDGPVLLPEEIQTELKHHKAACKTKIDFSPWLNLDNEVKMQQSRRMLEEEEKIVNRAG